MVYCGRCGQQNPDDSKFCTRCANPLTPQPPPQPQYQPPPPSYTPYVPPPKKDNTTLIIVVVILVAVLVIGGAYITWLVFREVEDLSDSEVTISISSYVEVTMELELEIEGVLVDSFTLAPGAIYQNTFQFDPFSGSSNAFEVLVIRYEGSSIYNTYEGTIQMDDNGEFSCDIPIYD
jgi:hypothetical protein